MMITLEEVSRVFKNNRAISNFNYNINLHNNDIIGVVGPNGAGKTTLLKIISGLLKPSSGVIKTDSKNIKYHQWVKDNVNFVLSGDRNLYFKNTAYENIMYFGITKGLRVKEIKKMIEFYADQFKIISLLDREVGTLSMGERKKISIIVGMCSHARLLILDEPSVGLDLHAVIELQNIIKSLNNIRQVTMLVSSHDIYFLSSISNSYLFINQGSNIFSVHNEMEIESIIAKYFLLMGDSINDDNS